MSDAMVTANGVPVIRADITRPRIGNWHADLVVNAPDADQFQGTVSIVLAETLTLKGTAFRVGAHHETVFIRVLGGNGGLGTELAPRAYTNVPVRLPLTDCLREAGETLSPTADAGALGSFLPKWVRMRQGAGTELGSLVKASGAESWRVLSDGTIWLGPEAWGPSSVDFQEIEFEPEIGRLSFACDVPTIDPGQTFTAPGESYDGSRVSMVRHVATADRVRHFAWFEDEVTGETDRVKAGLDAYLRTTVQPRIDAAACYWAKVISQNSDGTLELRPDSSKLPDLSRVPIRYGVPGVTAKISAGRVLVQFADGDVTQPIVTSWDTATVTEIVVAGGTQGVIRTSDPIGAHPTMRGWMDAIEASLTALGQSGWLPNGTPTTGAGTLFGVFRAGGSTKVKVG